MEPTTITTNIHVNEETDISGEILLRANETAFAVIRIGGATLFADRFDLGRLVDTLTFTLLQFPQPQAKEQQQKRASERAEALAFRHRECGPDCVVTGDECNIPTDGGED